MGFIIQCFERGVKMNWIALIISVLSFPVMGVLMLLAVFVWDEFREEAFAITCLLLFWMGWIFVIYKIIGG